MNARWRFLICLLLVGVLYAGHVGLKLAKIYNHPTWDAQDEVGQFWSEFAFHYRFAKFFATHADWSELSRDRQVQYPDTIDDWAEFTVAMEVPVGVLYRWLKPAVPLHVFVVWYGCLVSSLTLFGVFFLARALWRSAGAGVLASVLYATLYPSYGRTVKNLFLREDFAIPLIVFALYFTVCALQDKRRWQQIGAALFWLAALASWHLTQFVLAVGVGAAVLVYLGKGETPRVPWFVLVLTAGSVVIPVLWAKQLYLSPVMCVVYALSLAVWINGGRKKATLVFAGWLVVFLAASFLLRKSYGEYAHVYQLFFYKLRYLGVKPEDPALLPWEARCLWEGAFNTAPLGEWWHSLVWCGPLAVVGIVAALFERRSGNQLDSDGHRPPLQIFAVFTLMLVPLSWMVVRYFTFLGFAAAVVAAGLMTRRIWWRAAVIVAAGWQVALLNFEPLDRTPVVPDNYKPLVKWINANTSTNAVFLASIAEAPVFLAHTGRPIILHSKFENWEIRERYRQFLAAVYGTPAELVEFCRRYGADYLVFDAGFFITAKDSRRYKADKLGELAPDCAAVLLVTQRVPEFEPVFSANGYTILRVKAAP
ncbi:MAG: hypothetical protein PCFJNLEI_03924 [Verrucomicrobiae bacterium]|nr:hypothetical protein [Verrucomicrobiae bacterium]